MSVSGFSLVFIILVAVLNGKTSVRADVDSILDKLTAQSQDDKSHAASNPRRKLDVDVNDPSYNDVNENEPNKDDHVQANAGTDLNTRRVENATLKDARLSGATPEGDIEQEFDPLEYATCFNEDYKTDFNSIDQWELYKDYARIFNWGFRNEMGPPLEALSAPGIPDNRLPGMFLRMCFHDNAINQEQPQFQDYIDGFIQYDEKGWARWTGPSQYLRTSGADASVLVSSVERFHPNQNYDKTASRVLYSLQSKDIPDILDSNGKKTNMVEKYGLSYADMLHNGCVAAAIYIRPPVDWTGEVKDEKKDLANFPFKYGRKDACRYRWKEDNRAALCGPTELLPGLALTTKQVNDWFINRGMNPCQFMALMWTHTTIDDLAKYVENICPLLKLPCSTTEGVKLDYFSYFLQPGEHIPPSPEEILEDPESSDCKWTLCEGESREWPLTAIDCTLALDVAQRAVRKFPEDENLRELKNVIKDFHSVAVPPEKVLECSLRMLGGHGDKNDCNGIAAACTEIGTNVVPYDHFFGGYYGYGSKSNLY